MSASGALAHTSISDCFITIINPHIEDVLYVAVEGGDVLCPAGQVFFNITSNLKFDEATMIHEGEKNQCGGEAMHPT